MVFTTEKRDLTNDFLGNNLLYHPVLKHTKQSGTVFYDTVLSYTYL